ncbi:glycoside hydrolase [Granulicella sp. dw_53]|uniref:glycoside hydrolase n=1 Tax=Granulicella sp. dw_53 TaxID=2719792 RepID=UPI001BD6A8FC|nr:glycoside hydrolase [Granulicella sp. dw_53]
MRLKSFTVTVAALLLLSGVPFALWHSRHRSGFTLTQEPAYRFEPQPRPLFSARRPVVGSTVAGGLYLLTVEGSHEASTLQLRMSHDGGEHWMAPQRLSAEDATVNASSENAPQLASRAMYAYALWMDRSESSGSRILLARSSGMDAKPPVGVPVTDKLPTDKSYSGFPSLGLAPNGDVYAAWLDGRDNTSNGTFNIYLARSTDKGLTFHKNVKVAILSCPCCRPSIAFGPNGKVYVAYRHVYGDNERDIAVATSNDFGEHFSEPVRVNLDRWRILGCPESGPVMAVQNGKLLVVWYSAASNHPGLRLAQSTDGGASFHAPLSIDGNIPGANHPFLTATDDGRIALTFSGRTSGENGTWGSFSSFLVTISSDGKTTPPQTLPGTVSLDRYPTVALDADGSVFVATSNNGEESPTAYLYRARPTQ